MPNGEGWSCRLVTYAIGHEQDGRATVAGFKLVGDPLQSVAFFLFGLELLRFEITALGPRPAKPLNEFLAEEFSFLFHGRFCLGLSGCGQRRGAAARVVDLIKSRRLGMAILWVFLKG